MSDNPNPGSAEFGASYWTEQSAYRKFDDYKVAMEALRVWYGGIWKMLAPAIPQPAGRHLDAGCGHGSAVESLCERGWDAHGFDLSEWIIEQAQQAFPGAQERFAVGSFDEIPFDGEFDLITCFEVLEHVPDPMASLAALRARLRPGGRLIATTPNLRPLMPWWDPLTSDPTHINVHEPAWWRGAATAAGLANVRVSTFISLPLLWRLHPSLSRCLRLGDRVGPGVLILADGPAR